MTESPREGTNLLEDDRFEVLELTAAPTLHVGQSGLQRGFQFVRRYLFVVCASAYLLTVGQLRSRNRAFLHVIADFFGYRSPSAAALPAINAYELLTKNPEVRLVETAGVNGNVSLMELVILGALVRLKDARAMFEIGTFDGRTTLNLAVNAPGDARIYTLDLPPDNAAETQLPIDPDDRRYIDKPATGARFLQAPESARITQLYGDSATFEYSPYNGRMDLVFVDGSHSYEYVLHDSRCALELLRDRGGTILWHDYGTWLGVTRALNELHLADPRYKGLRRIQGTALAILEVNAADQR